MAINAHPGPALTDIPEAAVTPDAMVYSEKRGLSLV
jgi:hypothetical protein